MNIKSPKVLLKGKTMEKKVSSKTGNEYTNCKLYFATEDGIVHTLNFVSDFVFNKAEENKNYIIKILLDTKGNFEINDIEEVK